MAVNTFQYAQLFQQELDRQIVAQATTGWMEGNTSGLIYNGGNTIKIPKIDMDGLGNYDRANGFAAGSANLSYETMTLTMDRSRTFNLDSMDVNETNFVASASNIMGEFQRTKVVPEIDAYRYSKIASLAIGAGKASGGYTPAVADIYTKLKADIATVQDVIGYETPLCICMSISTLNTLQSSTEVTRFVELGATGEAFDGNVNTKFRTIDGTPIMPVPSARLKTAYTFNDGITAGQEAGGFVPAGTAKTINWIICAQNAPIAVSKTDNIRIFSPQQNINADAYKLDYRKYHDLWIPDNKLASVFVNCKEALA
ncbi:MAG: hypothetical protein ABF633_01720 [Clostridium sp.]|uniref:hypothetical protein n=1 Tax=Clostridium sp. TaxID=1506 RepID=UPI0039EBC02B